MPGPGPFRCRRRTLLGSIVLLTSGNVFDLRERFPKTTKQLPTTPRTRGELAGARRSRTEDRSVSMRVRGTQPSPYRFGPRTGQPSLLSGRFWTVRRMSFIDYHRLDTGLVQAVVFVWTPRPATPSPEESLPSPRRGAPRRRDPTACVPHAHVRARGRALRSSGEDLRGRHGSGAGPR